MFCDVIQTRSSSFRKKITPKFKTGDYLGDLTDEFEEYGSYSFVEEFVSGGPKTMRFRYFAARPRNVQQNAK